MIAAARDETEEVVSTLEMAWEDRDFGIAYFLNVDPIFKSYLQEPRVKALRTAMQYFETLPTHLKEKGYLSFQGGKWWEFNYQNGGFTHGMTTGWTEADRKKGNNWFKIHNISERK